MHYNYIRPERGLDCRRKHLLCMQEHFVKSISKSHATYCQTLPFCGYTSVITQVTHLWSHSSLIFLHLTKWKQKLLPRFVKWLSLVSITTSKEILLLQMDQKECLYPAFLSHMCTHTELWEHWAGDSHSTEIQHATKDVWEQQIWHGLSEMEVQNEKFQLLIFLLI